MIYAVRHLTTYRYEAPVAFARCNLRLTPEQRGGQELLAHEILVDPAPASRQVETDFFGFTTNRVTIEKPHRSLRIEARSRVRVERPQALGLEGQQDWLQVRDAALGSTDMGAASPVHFLSPTRRTPLIPAATDYCRESFPPGAPIVPSACRLMERICRDFIFDSKATTVSTPLAEVAERRRGVCQDFAHFMIAGLRGLGLPAAYVSGYLLTRPPPGQARLRGADASHAWVAVWHGSGWIDLDPTNGVTVGDGHVALARGRDYSDVCPVDGIVLMSGSQNMRVEVDVVPEDEMAA